MRNHLHTLMKQGAYWNDAKPLSSRDGWIYDLGTWSGSSNRVNRGL